MNFELGFGVCLYKTKIMLGFSAKLLIGRLRVGLGLHLECRLLFSSNSLHLSRAALSLQVAVDSPQTLSVLGNMGRVFDDCRLRFVQNAGAPLKIPPILGVQKRQKINFEKFMGM